jgi:hypothetical protein
MRSAFIIAVLLSLVLLGSVAQDSPLKPDGRMWETWGNSGSQNLFIKAAYVQGAMEGLRVGATVGYYSGRADEKKDALDYVKSCLSTGPLSPFCSQGETGRRCASRRRAKLRNVRSGVPPEVF